MEKVNILCFITVNEFGKLSESNAVNSLASLTHVTTVDDALVAFDKTRFPIVILKLGSRANGIDSGWPVLRIIKRKCKSTFAIILSRTASEDASIRMKLFDEGANMVTQDMKDTWSVVSVIAKTLPPNCSVNISRQVPLYKCPFCNLEGFTEDALWTHCPLYHVNEAKYGGHKSLKVQAQNECPICRSCSNFEPLQVHIRNKHGPCGRGEIEPEDKESAPRLYTFALVVVRRPEDGKYLLVQEFGDSGYWLPGGRVDGRESLQIAAIRETKEEAGVDIELTGILRLEYSPHSDGKGRSYVRMRVIFLGQPLRNNPMQLAKSIPDYESCGGVWVSPAEMELGKKNKSMRFRGSEPLQWIPYVEQGGSVCPMTLLTAEGSSVVMPAVSSLTSPSSVKM